MGEAEASEAPRVDPAELASWFVFRDARVIAIDKPGWLVCHPSKNGPYSSLAGAVRAHTGSDKLHLVSRLDRETSGVVLVALDGGAARRYQRAVQERRVAKTYFAVLEGELRESVEVDQPLGRDADSAVRVKQTVKRTNSAQKAATRFDPAIARGAYTLCRVRPITGRKHQIRAHARWLGHPVAGDKIYGPDETLYLRFIETGWTPELAERLPIARQALHCARVDFDFPEGAERFEAPLADDMRALCREGMGVDDDALAAALAQRA